MYAIFADDPVFLAAKLLTKYDLYDKLIQTTSRIKKVSKYEYLGVTIDEDGRGNKDK